MGRHSIGDAGAFWENVPRLSDPEPQATRYPAEDQRSAAEPRRASRRHAPEPRAPRDPRGYIESQDYAEQSDYAARHEYAEQSGYAGRHDYAEPRDYAERVPGPERRSAAERRQARGRRAYVEPRDYELARDDGDPHDYVDSYDYVEPLDYVEPGDYRDVEDEYPAAERRAGGRRAPERRTGGRRAPERRAPARRAPDRRASDRRVVEDRAHERNAQEQRFQTEHFQEQRSQEPSAPGSRTSRAQRGVDDTRRAARRASTQRRQEWREERDTRYAEPRSRQSRNGAAARAVDLRKTYGSGSTEVVALDGINVSFGRNEFTAIMGPSGSGKSTLMHTMAGLDSFTSGSAYIGDTDLARLRDKELTALRRDRLGFIFQSFNLVPTLTAAENITLPTDISGGRIDRHWFHEITTRLGLAKRLSHRPSELSGGQQQRVACARALVSRPEIIFGDEPTGNLDSNSSREVLEILRAAVDGDEQTVVIVTHDARAASYADRVIFLADGQIVDELRNPTMESILQTMSGIEN